MTYLDSTETAENQERARLPGDKLGEMMWSLKLLVASGYGVADGAGKLDNGLFDFRPKITEETFQRFYASSGGK